MLRLATILLLVTAVLGGGVFYLARAGQADEVRARISTSDALRPDSGAGFARALAPRPFTFPADHGPHPEFQTEWWYYTGNLSTADGRRFGFQLTFFRRALTPTPTERPSAWGTSQVYLAHFAVSDIGANKFYAVDRFGRGAAGLAGAQAEPFRVWLEDWSADGSGPQAMQMRLRARQGDVAIDLALDGAARTPVLQGDEGLSQKSAAPGNASYYYSLTRMPANGSISAGGTTYQVTGLAWMDREWSTSALGEDQIGWDWFALQLDDGRDLMYYQLRRRDGSVDPFSKGIIVAANGTTTSISSSEARLEPVGTWRSSRSGGVYPASWRLSVPTQNLELEVTPRMADQELPLTIVYWEGAVAISGTAAGKPVSGSGYLEMTGYGEQDAGGGEGISR